MKDTLAIIWYGALLVLTRLVGAVLIVAVVIGTVMATLAIPVVLIIWAIGALL